MGPVAPVGVANPGDAEFPQMRELGICGEPSEMSGVWGLPIMLTARR